jgi:hypothetical protein
MRDTTIGISEGYVISTGPQLLCALPDEAADGTATRPLRYAPIKSVPTHSGGAATTLAGNTPFVQPARRFILSRRS